MDFTEYRQAVIHLAWFRDDQVRHLLFGMVELRPNEFPDAIGCPPKGFRVGNKGRKYLYYRRFVLSVEDAIAWYRKMADGNIVLPRDPNHSTPGDGAKLEGGPFEPEPPWPYFVTSNELAFAPDWMQDSRTHFLFPKNVLSPEVSAIIGMDKNRAKLEEWLNFDIAEAYYDYQGAVCLVAPNPVFRLIEKFHFEQAREGTAETVAYKLVARQGQCLDGLRLEIVNERLHGRMTLIHEFDNDAIAVLDFPAQVYKEGQSVMHPKYGLLAWHEPVPPWRTIDMKIDLHLQHKTIHVPSGGRRRPKYKYEVNEFEEERKITVGNALENIDIVSRLTEAANQRSRRQAAKDYDQQWFHDVPSKAAQWVRQKIGGARDTVLIVDPYFAGRELLAFGPAVRRPDIELRILTSAQGLKEIGRDDQNTDSGSQLLEILNNFFKERPTKPEIRILKGDPPPVHDRFLVVDGTVWFSGNSLRTIGERAGMIVKLPDPEPVIVRLGDFWSAAPCLSDWLSNRPAPEAS
ncbi:MAG: VPA1262 family N-terminal domain-containing protein [Gemmatimonadota bacterium]|nr:VPA1262 family N-terminal domain-containing protein [Gemmatimonadota bacterium]